MQPSEDENGQGGIDPLRVRAEHGFNRTARVAWPETGKAYTYHVHDSITIKSGDTALIVKPDGKLLSVDVLEVSEFQPQSFLCKPILAAYSKEDYEAWVLVCKEL